MIQSLRDINLDIDEGKLLMAALSIITTTTETDKTPEEVLCKLDGIQSVMFNDTP